MNTYADRRDTRRVIVGPEFGISFLLKGHAFRDVRITNLSVGGCFALLSARDARLFERGAVLENLVLQEESLPKGPILAGVSYVLGNRPTADPTEMVGVGVQFLGMGDETQEALEAWVSSATTAKR